MDCQLPTGFGQDPNFDPYLRIRSASLFSFVYSSIYGVHVWLRVKGEGCGVYYSIMSFGLTFKKIVT